jgi:hypothetical protein
METFILCFYNSYFICLKQRKMYFSVSLKEQLHMAVTSATVNVLEPKGDKNSETLFRRLIYLKSLANVQ